LIANDDSNERGIPRPIEKEANLIVKDGLTDENPGDEGMLVLARR
jgi:hypothetical protein